MLRLRIHRGTAEIGGNCIELEAEGKSLILDLGAPLMPQMTECDPLPLIDGLTDGTNPNLLGIVISHPHADHYGLVDKAHSSIPVYIGKQADTLLRAASAFTSFGVNLPHVIHYHHRQSFQAGPFQITPYLVDHSAFDAYAFIIKANGKTIFYSGDLRGHGWKATTFDELLNMETPVDVMLLEGTTLGRDEASTNLTEAALAQKMSAVMERSEGLVLAMFAGQNIDRFVTSYKATRASKRYFVVDLYLAHLLHALQLKSLPDPTGGGLRVFCPQHDKIKIVRNKTFELITPFKDRRMYTDELRRRASALTLSFRASMASLLEKADCLQGATLIYSLWPGYLDRTTPDLRDWCQSHGIQFELMHTSGHASRSDLKRLIQAINPRQLIPIHTLVPEQYHTLHDNVLPVSDHIWYPC